MSIFKAEPVFVDHLRGPGIESQPGGPVRQPCYSYKPAEPHRLAESISRNRFLGSIIDYKYGLWNQLRSPVLPPPFAENQFHDRTGRFLGSINDYKYGLWNQLRSPVLPPLFAENQFHDRTGLKIRAQQTTTVCRYEYL
jgi:hypothetical protein